MFARVEEFEALNQVKLQYNYAWIYDKKPATEKKEKKIAEDAFAYPSEAGGVGASAVKFLGVFAPTQTCRLS